MAANFAKYDKQFNQQQFVKDASHNLENHELKERSNQIIVAMQKHLPAQLEDCAPIILNSLSVIDKQKEQGDELFSQTYSSNNYSLKGDEKQTVGIDGWAIMPIADFIGIKATLNEKTPRLVPLAMSLFKEVTKRFSAEFGIRYLLTTFPDETIAILKTWLSDSNQHVRRLISEGSRPRLPWGMQLPLFIKDPSPVIELLAALKDDKEEYVRRSVANNLNDIAKDHPPLVNAIAKKWLINADKNRQKLIRHACRTLIKNSDKETLAILGYKKAQLKNISFKLNKEKLIFGEAIELQLTLASDSNSEQGLIIDYIIHHQKANGSTSPKTFKWKVCQLAENKKLTAKKKHSIKKITTRVYYPGIHTVEIIANGNVIAKQQFELVI